MSKLYDVSDPKPNAELVDMLCELLIDAQKGELKGMAVVCEWRKDRMSQGWSLPKGTDLSHILGELVLLQDNIKTKAQLRYRESVLLDYLDAMPTQPPTDD